MSYLENQKCKVCIGNDYSETITFNSSVPHCGILSSYLFNSYSSTIDTVIPLEISINAFADDHSLQKSFVPCKKEEKKEMNMLESIMNNIDEWMGSNWLKMNASKIEFILFCTNHQLKKTTSIEINVCRENVKKSEIVRYLGAWLDSNLNFKHHASIKCKSAIWNLWKFGTYIT